MVFIAIRHFFYLNDIINSLLVHFNNHTVHLIWEEYDLTKFSSNIAALCKTILKKISTFVLGSIPLDVQGISK